MPSVEMRRLVIFIKHHDGDAVELRNRRHRRSSFHEPRQHRAGAGSPAPRRWRHQPHCGRGSPRCGSRSRTRWRSRTKSTSAHNTATRAIPRPRRLMDRRPCPRRPAAPAAPAARPASGRAGRHPPSSPPPPRAQIGRPVPVTASARTVKARPARRTLPQPSGAVSPAWGAEEIIRYPASSESRASMSSLKAL